MSKYAIWDRKEKKFVKDSSGNTLCFDSKTDALIACSECNLERNDW